jgi:hypothetical protein
LRVLSGFTDALSLLWHNTKYALKHDRTIIFITDAYSATDLDDLIDFTNFPVKVLCGEQHIEKINFLNIEPSCFALDPYMRPNGFIQNPFYNHTIDGVICIYDVNNTYPEDTLLIFMACGNYGDAFFSIKHITFKSSFISKFTEQRAKLPETYSSAHLRATDHYNQNLTRDLAKLNNFIKDKPAVYLASDNMSLMESLAKKHPQIIKSVSYKKTDETYYSLHHTFGKTDPECLSNALIDMLICALADNFLPSVGAFSKLIKQLHEDKELLSSLIRS